MANNEDRKDAKRQKIQSEQRAAYNEDMAQIQRALREAEPSATAVVHETENKNSGDGHQEQQEEEKNNIQPSQPPQPQQQQQQQVGQESDDDEEGAGNWLKTFTPHHTRVGSEFQVTELPTPQANVSREPAVIAPKQ
jgi:hypothetical protein